MSAVSMEQKRHTYQLAASVMRPTNLPWGMTGVCLQADVRDKLEKSLTCQLVLKRVRDEDTLCSLLHCTDQGNQSYTGEKGICNSALSQDAINIKVGGITCTPSCSRCCTAERYCFCTSTGAEGCPAD